MLGDVSSSSYGREGLPGQLRAWLTQLPSAGESNFTQPQLRQTARQTLRYVRPHRSSAETHLLASPARRQPARRSPLRLQPCEGIPQRTGVCYGHRFQDRGPSPSSLTEREQANPCAQGRALVKTIAKDNSAIDLEGSRQTAPARAPWTPPSPAALGDARPEEKGGKPRASNTADGLRVAAGHETRD